METLTDLIDATDMAARYPDTFGVPSAKQLMILLPGDYVKVCRNNERFWIKLTSVSDVLVGTVDNNLISNPDLPLGTLVACERRHVFNVG